MAAGMALQDLSPTGLMIPISNPSWHSNSVSSHEARFPFSGGSTLDADTLEFIASVLKCREDPDDEDPATDYALSVVLQELSASINSFIAQSGLKPDVYGNGQGGIRVSWRHKNREVRLILPRDAALVRYLYWQEGSSYEAIPHFTSVTLENRLSRLSGKQRV